MIKPRKLIGEILKEMEVVSNKQIEEALRIQEEYRNLSSTGGSAVGGLNKDNPKPIKRIGEILIEKGWANQGQITMALAHQHNVKFMRFPESIPEEILKIIPKNIVSEYNVIPVNRKGKTVTIASADPLDVFTMDNLRFMTGAELECVFTTPEGLSRGLKKYYGLTSNKHKDSVEDKENNVVIGNVTTIDEISENDAPIIKLVSFFVSDAVKNKASDIHIEPMENELRIRYRIDGVCVPVESPSQELKGTFISRIKLLAGMDIAEKRKPQDGRIPMIVSGKDFDIRVSSLPASHGESVVLRLLEKQTLLPLDELGLNTDEYQRFKNIIRRPNGIFLVTGPTGSGKTTTLYAAVSELNRPNVKIITAEDPVEYVLPGVNQCRVRTDIGFTFASIIRAMLRQAPNIILIGEIRDLETADIAIQAALTGHLVFSTLHTNDAPSSLTRLLDLGVRSFLVSSSIQAIMAQRLVRLLCPKCKEHYHPTIEELNSVGLAEKEITDKTIYKAVGCKECYNTGYKGRIGIFELMEMNSTLREMVFRKEPTIKLREQAMASGMTSLMHDGARKILQGITTIEEVILITKREDISY